MALNIFYRCRVSDELPAYDIFPNFQAFEPLNTESFNIYFRVRFAFRFNPSLFLMENMREIHTFQSMSCEQFFQEGPAFLRRNLSHPMIYPGSLDQLIPTMMSYAQHFYDEHHCSWIGVHSAATYPLTVEIIVELEEIEEDLEMVLWESIEDQGTLMIPASEEAIMSLNTVKVEDNIGVNADHCCICLEEYDKGVEVSALPCHHIYHSNCIVHWLKTSHLCPLCRYEMPIISNNDNSF